MAGSRFSILAMTFAAAMTLLSACGPKKTQPTRTPAPGAPNTMTNDADRHVSELLSRASALRKAADALPARDVDDDARRTVEAFDRAADALEALAGPDPAGAFRQQLRTMKASRDQIVRASGPNGAAPEPVVDSGLRAMNIAMTEIRERHFPANADVAEQLNQLRSRLEELDAVRGPLHRLVVAQAFEAMAGAVEKMADVYEKRESATAPAAR
jgi:hypothetical protein